MEIASATDFKSVTISSEMTSVLRGAASSPCTCSSAEACMISTSEMSSVMAASSRALRAHSRAQTSRSAGCRSQNLLTTVVLMRVPARMCMRMCVCVDSPSINHRCVGLFQDTLLLLQVALRALHPRRPCLTTPHLGPLRPRLLPTHLKIP